MNKIRDAVGFYLGFCLIFLFSINLSLSAQDSPEKDITLEWMYKKKELGIPEIGLPMPKQLNWSKQGHILAYLVSSATEAPNLVFYDPVKNATAFCITPTELYAAVVQLASQPEGVPVADTRQIVPLPKDATDWLRIDGYEWQKDRDAVRLNVGEKKYLWDMKSHQVKEDKIPSLPEGEKNDVAYSPNQRYAAYTRANDLYVYDTEQKKEIRLTQDGSETTLNGKLSWVYWEELHYRRSGRAFYWSPNNDALAYLQFDEKEVSIYPVTDFSQPVPHTRMMRYPKVGTKNPSVRVGVVSLSTRETRWIDLQEPYEYIYEVTWHPTGKFLAVQTLNRRQDQLTLRFADPVNGVSRVILKETDPAFVNVQGGPFFLKKTDGFLWLSERSGFRHLYYYSCDGKTVKPLTKGEWEVNPDLWQITINVDEDNRQVYFTANEKSPLEAQIYSVPLHGGPLHKVTKAPGMHTVQFSADYLFCYDSYTNLEVPRKLQVLNRRGRVIQVLGEIKPTDYAPYRIHSPEILSLKDSEGNQFYASFLKPFNFDPNRKYPVIVYVYGGPAGQMVLNDFVNPNDMAMVNRGFLLFAFDTRGTPGRGRKWLNAVHKNACDVPLQDLSFFVDYLKKLPYVNPEHIGVWGWSNGGYMTCCAILKKPGLFHSGAAVAPVLDWKLYDTIYTERYLGLPEENPDGYKESAPIYFAKNMTDRLLLAHGVSDDNVHIQNIYYLVNQLIESNKDYELYVYPERDHGIGGEDRRYHLFQRILNFFEKN